MPDWTVQYFTLPDLDDDRRVHLKEMSNPGTVKGAAAAAASSKKTRTYSATKSSNVTMLATHKRNRRSRRADACITVNGISHSIATLTKAQLDLVAGAGTTRMLSIDKDEFDRAGETPGNDSSSSSHVTG